MNRRTLIRRIMPFMIAAMPALAACSWWMAGYRTFGERDPLIFDHNFHYEMGVECSDCHGEVEAATDLHTSFRPGEAACLECHDRDTCTDCHTNPEAVRAWQPPPTKIRFSHAAHMERVDSGCLSCHTDAESSTSGEVAVPGMDFCLGCHNHEQNFASAQCEHCHTTLQTVPLSAIAEFEHTGDWIAHHGAQARSQGATCLQCHPQTTCAGCHSKTAAAAEVRLTPDIVGRTLLHRGDFATTHAIEARADGAMCLRCHTVPTCSNCHAAVGLTPDGTDPRSPHPSGYALPGASSFHGTDARQRVETCAACHQDGPGSVCVDCHAVGGVGGSPHPMGFSGTTEAIPGNAMCRYCHVR